MMQSLGKWQPAFTWRPRRSIAGGWVWGKCYQRNAWCEVGIQTFFWTDYISHEHLLQAAITGVIPRGN